MTVGAQRSRFWVGLGGWGRIVGLGVGLSLHAVASLLEPHLACTPPAHRPLPFGKLSQCLPNMLVGATSTVGASLCGPLTGFSLPSVAV